MAPVPVQSPNPARYLVRFDDLCPTMLLDRWARFLSIIARYGIRPILAIIPVIRIPPSSCRRRIPTSGSNAITRSRRRHHRYAWLPAPMHQYGKPILRLHQETEFAGVEQCSSSNGFVPDSGSFAKTDLNPRLFVAPRHGFDLHTLRALADEGLGILSDGFAHRPVMRQTSSGFRSSFGSRSKKRPGFGPSASIQYRNFRLKKSSWRDFSQNTGQFTTFDRVIADIQPTRLNWTEAARRNSWPTCAPIL